jgi:hypothetical protein
MAIKGKRRGKARSGRTVAAPPRPFMVPTKVPLLRRTGAKVVLVIAAQLVLFSLLIAMDAASDAGRRQDRIEEFSTLLNAQLFQSGVAQQTPGGALVLPEMGQAISGLQGGEVEDQEALAEQAEEWSRLATEASEDVGGLQTDIGTLGEARDLMEQGLLLYAGLADEVGIAVGLEEEPRAGLTQTITEQLQVAAQIFDAGFRKLQEERLRAGLALGAPAGVPGAGEIPGLPGAPGVPGIPGAPGVPGTLPTP